MKLNKNLIVAPFLLLLLLALPLFGQHGGQHFKLRMAERMELTEEQQESFKKIMTETQEKILPLMSDLKIKKAELDKLLIADKPSQNSINKKIDEISELKNTMQKIRIASRLDIRKQLTDEQRVKFDSMKMRRRGFVKRGFGMHGRMGRNPENMMESGRGFRHKQMDIWEKMHNNDVEEG